MFRIIQAKPDEQHWVRALHALLFDAEAWHDTNLFSIGTWLVWSEDDEPVGFGALGHTPYADGAFISYIGLLPSARGHGLGPRLIRAMTRRAKRLGYKRVVSYTWNDNIPSARSFFRCGFRLFRPESAAPDYMWFEKDI